MTDYRDDLDIRDAAERNIIAKYQNCKHSGTKELTQEAVGDDFDLCEVLFDMMLSKRTADLEERAGKLVLDSIRAYMDTRINHELEDKPEIYNKEAA